MAPKFEQHTQMDRSAPVKDNGPQLRRERIAPSERHGAMDLMRREMAPKATDFDSYVVDNISKRSGLASKGDSRAALTAIDNLVDTTQAGTLEQRIIKARTLISSGFSKESTSFQTIREMTAGYKLILEKHGFTPDQINQEMATLANVAIKKHLGTYRAGMNDFEKKGLFEQSKAIAIACGVDRSGFNKTVAVYIDAVANSTHIALTNIEKGGLQKKAYIVNDLSKIMRLDVSAKTPAGEITEAHKAVQASKAKVRTDMVRAGIQ